MSRCDWWALSYSESMRFYRAIPKLPSFTGRWDQFMDIVTNVVFFNKRLDRWQ
jgi:hypothetical protein